jgi:hypothetical protein
MRGEASVPGSGKLCSIAGHARAKWRLVNLALNSLLTRDRAGTDDLDAKRNPGSQQFRERMIGDMCGFEHWSTLCSSRCVILGPPQG